jgi:hypothetical protein
MINQNQDNAFNGTLPIPHGGFFAVFTLVRLGVEYLSKACSKRPSQRRCSGLEVLHTGDIWSAVLEKKQLLIADKSKLGTHNDGICNKRAAVDACQTSLPRYYGVSQV